MLIFSCCEFSTIFRQDAIYSQRKHDVTCLVTPEWPDVMGFQPITSFVSIAMLGIELVVGVTFRGYGGKHVTCCLETFAIFVGINLFSEHEFVYFSDLIFKIFPAAAGSNGQREHHRVVRPQRTLSSSTTASGVWGSSSSGDPTSNNECSVDIPTKNLFELTELGPQSSLLTILVFGRGGVVVYFTSNILLFFASLLVRINARSCLLDWNLDARWTLVVLLPLLKCGLFSALKINEHIFFCLLDEQRAFRFFARCLFSPVIFLSCCYFF